MTRCTAIKMGMGAAGHTNGCRQLFIRLHGRVVVQPKVLECGLVTSGTDVRLYTQPHYGRRKDCARMRSDSHSPLPAPIGGSPRPPWSPLAAIAAGGRPVLSASGSVSGSAGVLVGVFVSPPSACASSPPATCPDVAFAAPSEFTDAEAGAGAKDVSVDVLCGVPGAEEPA